MVLKTNYRLIQVQGEHSAILSSFIKLPFFIKIFVLSISEWPLKIHFTQITLSPQHTVLSTQQRAYQSFLVTSLV